MSNHLFMNLKKIILFVTVTLIGCMLHAQGYDISGIVTDRDGVPLSGVNIVVDGTNVGTQTDFDGNFTIKAGNDAILSFSYVGFEDQKITITEEQELTIVMDEGSKLDEVVVIGYGKENKRDLVGAISQVKATDVKDMPVTDIGRRLQGKVAGLQINQNRGEPGGEMSIRIRGSASINAGNRPLIVLDGFPSELGLEDINPDDIESMSVLKDAASASLYGSRAANGVILINTKQGKEGKVNIEFSSFLGINKVPKKGRPDVMDAVEFATFKKEYYEDQAKYEGYTGGVPERYQNPEQYAGKGIDWYDVLLRTGLTQNYNLSFSSGTDKFKSYSSLNHSHEKGVILNTFSERTSIRTNNIYSPTDKLTFGLNMNGLFKKRQITEGLGEGRNIIELAYLMDPTQSYVDSEGNYPISIESPGMFANPNWYLVLRDRENKDREMKALSNVFAEYEILDGLEYRFSINANLISGRNRKFVPSTVQGGMADPPPQRATGQYNTNNVFNWLVENTISYEKKLWDRHKLSALAGYSDQNFRSETSGIDAIDFPDDKIHWVNAADQRIGSANITKSRLISYFGRLNYSYDKKYLLSLAYRRDGSSRFGSSKKWGNFPSVSLGWVVSDENFMPDLNVIDFFKIRGNYGEVGNNNIGDYTHLALFGKTNYVFNGSMVPGKSLTGLNNPMLTWEKTKSYDVGFDLDLFKHRISLSYDYYNKKTKGLLYDVDVPSNAGFRTQTTNVGQFDFWGHEITLNTVNIDEEFKWDTNINISFDRNKVRKLGLNDAPIGGQEVDWDENRTAVDHPIGLFYGFVYDGVYMSQEEFDSQPHGPSDMVGTTRYKDVNGDGIIDNNDRTFVGDPNPDFIYGITNNFSYRNFDLSVVMAGTVGNDIADDNLSSTENLDGVFNVRREVSERWRSPDNPGNGVVPRTRTGTTETFRNFTSRHVFSGTYLAIKNITFGYNLPLDQLGFVNNARVYFSGQNLFIFTKYPGMNPEVGIEGINGLRLGRDFSSYPISRTYSIGLSIKF